MAATTYTSADLIADIELVGHVPLGNSTFTAARLLRLATMELQAPIAKQILSTRGGYYLTYKDYEPVASGEYVIPEGAIGGALADVQLIQNTTIIPVNIIEPSEQFATNSPTSTSYGCFYMGNTLKIIPAPGVGYPRLWYTKRTSEIVQTTDCAQVTAINGAVITVASLPSDFVVDTEIDVAGDNPPFNILAERTITAVTGTDVTLDEEVTDLAIGDWLCLRGQTCIPQCPVEFRVLLTQRVVVKIYEIQGYRDKMDIAMAKLKELENDTFSLITPRIKSQSKIINPVNGGFLAGGRRQTNFPAGHIP